MMDVPVVYIKDKQAFSKKAGMLLLIGKPIEIAKELHKKGTELVHFIDLDAEKGNPTNLDIYDNLTYLMHIQVEGPKDEKAIKKLLSINARVVVKLPTSLNLVQFAEKKKLLVGRIENEGQASDDVFDLLYCGSARGVANLFKSKRRIIVSDKSLVPKGKKPFGVLTEL